MKKWENFSEEELKNIVETSYSYAQVSKKLGYSSESGHGVEAAKEIIKKYNLDISHFKGQGWNKDNFDYSRFHYGNNIKSSVMVSALINLRGRKCEKCELETWLGQPINLEVHHIDGDHLNSELDNLILLCPNCHSYTESWRKPKKKDYVDEKDFVEALRNKPNIRQALIFLGLSAKGANYSRARELIQKYNIQHLL